MFTNNQYGKAEEAIQFYISIFNHSKLGNIARYPKGMEPDQEGNVMFADFFIEHQPFIAMESARAHDFHFNEAISFIVYCDTQEEIDYYWEKLSALSNAEQCGWLKDKYGVSRQIIPRDMEVMMEKGTPEQINRVNQAVLKMKKLILAELRKVYND